MERLLLLIFASTVLLSVSFHHAAAGAEDVVQVSADGVAPGIENLVYDFLRGLAAKDRQGLERLRVTEQEYRDIIIPGTVAPGQPPRSISEKPSEYFWRTLDTRSRYSLDFLLDGFGGHKYRRKRIEFSEGERQYAGYTAYGEVRLVLDDEAGEEKILRTGWVARLGDRYKFIGFNSSD